MVLNFNGITNVTALHFSVGILYLGVFLEDKRRGHILYVDNTCIVSYIVMSGISTFFVTSVICYF